MRCVLYFIFFLHILFFTRFFSLHNANNAKVNSKKQLNQPTNKQDKPLKKNESLLQLHKKRTLFKKNIITFFKTKRLG